MLERLYMDTFYLSALHFKVDLYVRPILVHSQWCWFSERIIGHYRY